MRSLLLALWLLAAPLSAQEHLTVRFLDVGQADAVLLSHQGAHILYDAGLPLGSKDSTRVADRLREIGVDTLDFLATSHPHWDHIAGAPPVLDSLVVMAYVSAGPEVRSDSQIHARLYESLLGGIELGPVPDYGVLGEEVELTWLHPPDDSTHWSLNDRSMGLRACLEAACVMLGGDAEEAAWSYWMAEGLVEPVAVHKASHHGSRNGDTPDAMAVLSPALVVIGVGEGNRYGHPDEDALRLYEEVGARVLRTDRHGEIVIQVHADGTLRTSTEHGSNR